MPRKPKESKPRKKRGPIMRIFFVTLKGAGVLLILLVLVYVGLVIRYNSAGKIDPKTDYIAKLNEPYANIPQSERAWPLYREALVAIGPIPERIADTSGPQDPTWPEVVEFVRAREDALALLRKAASKPHAAHMLATHVHEEDAALWEKEFGPEYFRSDKGSLINVDFSVTFLYRNVAKLLSWLAIDAAERDDLVLSISCVEAIFGVAQHSDESRLLIAQLVSISNEAIANNTITYLLIHHAQALSNEQLLHLDRLLARQTSGGHYQIDFTGEEYFVADFEQRTYTDDGSGSGILMLKGLQAFEFNDMMPGQETWLDVVAAPVASAIMPTRREFRERREEIFRHLEEQQAKPLWERGESLSRESFDETEDSPLAHMRWRFLLVSLPAFSQTLTSASLHTMQLQATRVAIALERFKRNAGHYPDTLDPLVPEYLAEVPPDRYDGQPMRYKLDDDGQPLLYSIGANYQDDNGAVGEDWEGWPSNDDARRWRPRERMFRDLPETDIILYPPLPKKPVEPPPAF